MNTRAQYSSLVPGGIKSLLIAGCFAGLSTMADSALKGIRKQEVVYGNIAGRKLTGSLFLPADKKEGPFPAVVYLHGGGWLRGSKEQFEPLAAAMVRSGFIGLCINYRLSNEKKYPAAIQDAKCAVRYLRANAKKFNLDSARIGVAGGSAGAHLAACLAVTRKDLKPEWEGSGGYADFDSSVQAAVFFNGIYDLAALNKASRNNDFLRIFLGKTYKQAPSLYRDASPTSYLKSGICPCLIMHGTKDRVVPVASAVEFNNRIKSVGGKSQLITVPGVGHGWFRKPPHFDQCLKSMKDFFTRQLKKKGEVSS